MRYSWWRYVKSVIRAYLGRCSIELYGVALHEQEAVKAAIEKTKNMEDGKNRLKLIRLLHWESQSLTLDGVATAIPCDRATAARWQRKFFEEVARNLGLMD